MQSYMHGTGRRNLKHLNDHQEECLQIMIEECAEVIQDASKIKRFGLVGKRVDGKTNLHHLESEIGDVLAMIDLIVGAGLGVTREGIDTAKADKFVRLSKYMHTWNQGNIQ